MDIRYIELHKDKINAIKPLWENLKDHHHQVSVHFPERYIEFSFKKRKEELLRKSENGSLKVDMARDNNKRYVGYCVSSISNELIGEVDSIYVEEEYRSFGIGDELIKRALNWMDERGAKTKRIVVAVGNEELLSFYKHYNFFPRHLILEQK